MSSTKKAQYLDMLGETHLPDDMFTDTDGLNGLLDTYPDLGKGMGVLEHEVLGEPKSPPSLPDGIVMYSSTEEESPDQMVFGGMGDLERVTRQAALADLSWLDLAEQDPERLPKNPVDRGIPELEQAWGVDRRTDGVNLLPAVDRDRATYEQNLASARSAGVAPAQLNEIVRRAGRRVTVGASFRTAAMEVAERLGPDAEQAREAMTRLRDDAGLLGKVFVRATHFPGCDTGKWTASVREHAAPARYVVRKKACGDCIHAQEGSCALFHKKLVASVPWDEALRAYSPVLEATGRKVATEASPKEALRKAFAQAPKGPTQSGSDVRPTHLVAADQVSTEQARRAFHSAKAEHKVIEPTTPDPRARVLAHVARWVASGVLSREDGSRLASSKADPHAILKAAAALTGAKTRAFTGGAGTEQHTPIVSRDAAWAALAHAESQVGQVDALVKRRASAAIKAKVATVVEAIERGFRGTMLRNLIQRTLNANEVPEASKLLGPILRRTGALDAAVEVREFTGTHVERAPAETRAAAGPAHGEVGRLVRWARQKMSEGSAGSELDQLLSHRFADSVRTAATNTLLGLRRAHEGLSGHIYVDAAAYASATGTQGCEDGALKHRANAIPTVLGLDRCGTCARKAHREDGTPVCQVYNKPIVASAPVEDPAAYQAEMIRLADGTDADRTASLFANTYDASEFHLGGASELDHIVLADTPSNEKMADVFTFGGLELE